MYSHLPKLWEEEKCSNYRIHVIPYLMLRTSLHIVLLLCSGFLTFGYNHNSFSFYWSSFYHLVHAFNGLAQNYSRLLLLVVCLQSNYLLKCTNILTLVNVKVSRIFFMYFLRVFIIRQNVSFLSYNYILYNNQTEETVFV